MQMATIEYGRNVVGLKGANTTEINPKTAFDVIHIMPNQAEYLAKKQYGGTIRLGAWPCIVKKGTKLHKAYVKYGLNKKAPWWLPKEESQKPQVSNGDFLIYERHRHRYEFNNEFKEKYEKKGFIFSGTSPDGKLVEAIELQNHPFFIGTQFHPEYISRPLTPHPIFISFLESCI